MAHLLIRTKTKAWSRVKWTLLHITVSTYRRFPSRHSHVQDASTTYTRDPKLIVGWRAVAHREHPAVPATLAYLRRENVKFIRLVYGRVVSNSSDIKLVFVVPSLGSVSASRLSAATTRTIRADPAACNDHHGLREWRWQTLSLSLSPHPAFHSILSHHQSLRHSPAGRNDDTLKH